MDAYETFVAEEKSKESSKSSRGRLALDVEELLDRAVKRALEQDGVNMKRKQAIECAVRGYWKPKLDGLTKV